MKVGLRAATPAVLGAVRSDAREVTLHTMSLTLKDRRACSYIGPDCYERREALVFLSPPPIVASETVQDHDPPRFFPSPPASVGPGQKTRRTNGDSSRGNKKKYTRFMMFRPRLRAQHVRPENAHPPPLPTRWKRPEFGLASAPEFRRLERGGEDSWCPPRSGLVSVPPDFAEDNQPSSPQRVWRRCTRPTPAALPDTALFFFGQRPQIKAQVPDHKGTGQGVHRGPEEGLTG